MEHGAQQGMRRGWLRVMVTVHRLIMQLVKAHQRKKPRAKKSTKNKARSKNKKKKKKRENQNVAAKKKKIRKKVENKKISPTANRGVMENSGWRKTRALHVAFEFEANFGHSGNASTNFANEF